MGSCKRHMAFLSYRTLFFTFNTRSVHILLFVFCEINEWMKKRTLESKKQRGRQRETTSAIFPRHDSHWWLLRRCLATVSAVLRRQLPPTAGHRRLLQGCLAAVAAVLHRRLPPAKWWESLTCCFSGTAEYQKKSANGVGQIYSMLHCMKNMGTVPYSYFVKPNRACIFKNKTNYSIVITQNVVNWNTSSN